MEENIYLFIFALSKKPHPLSPLITRPVDSMRHLVKALKESIVDQVVLYSDNNNLINLHQSEYRKKFSTQTVILNLTDIIRRGVELDFVTILLMFDFSKAFDTIDHTILLKRLHNLGFTHHVLQ